MNLSSGGLTAFLIWRRCYCYGPASPACGRWTTWPKLLYVRTDMAQAILEDLAQRELISVVPNQPQRYVYAVHSDRQSELMQAVDRSGRHELVRLNHDPLQGLIPARFRPRLSFYEGEGDRFYERER